jgi:hypothetical protein
VAKLVLNVELSMCSVGSKSVDMLLMVFHDEVHRLFDIPDFLFNSGSSSAAVFANFSMRLKCLMSWLRLYFRPVINGICFLCLLLVAMETESSEGGGGEEQVEERVRRVCCVILQQLTVHLQKASHSTGAGGEGGHRMGVPFVSGLQPHARDICTMLVKETNAHRSGASGLDTKDCTLAWDNQIWLSGKQISMQICPPDNQIFCFFVDI